MASPPREAVCPNEQCRKDAVMKRIVGLLMLGLALMLQASAWAATGEQAGKTSVPKGPSVPTVPTVEQTATQLLKLYDERFANLLPLPFTAISIGTWNTMLQPWLPYEDRVIAEIAKTNLDVLVLQEVWTAAARDRILARVRTKYPYTYEAPAVQRTAKAFWDSPQSVNDYISCLVSTGTDTRTLDQPRSPIDAFCGFLGLNIALADQPAFECLESTMATLPSGDPGAFGATELCAQANGVKYMHEGRPGVLILSRRPLKDVEAVSFTSYKISRVNIYATISGVRFAFVAWPTNVLYDIDPSLGPLQTGALQPELAQDVIVHRPGVVVGDLNSGANYQPEGVNLLTTNGYRALFPHTDSYCPASLQSFAPCGDLSAVPAAIDNILIKERTGACLTGTFGKDQQSDHIGLAALCILKKQ
jgi:hypothetical protein